MESVWAASMQNRVKQYEPLTGPASADVLVVGGGMAGVLCARLLQDAGMNVILAEAKRLGSGVTGNTTAKVTVQHGAVYADLLREQGSDTARGYYTAQAEALKKIRSLAAGIDCAFEEKTAYIYARQNLESLQNEAEAYAAMSIPHEYREGVALPGGPATALGIPGQAQFNPLQFLHGASAGLRIYENTPVLEVKDGIAITEQGEIRARHIILATHYPMVNIPGLYFAKLNQQRSYVLALENGPQLDGMYIGLDGGRESFRNYGGLLFVGGGNHTTGEPGGQYAAIRSFAAQHLPGTAERFAWATQDTMSLDKMPYIGRHHGEDDTLLVATGFNKWGMTGSMVAAMVLCEGLTKGTGGYSPLFSPQRAMPGGALGHRAGETIKGYLHGGKRCTHMGCALRWNGAEGSWDCPCHGSRFDGRSGAVLDNPAQKPLHIHH